MAPIIIFKSLGVVFGSWYFVPMKKNKEYTLPIVFGAVLNFILNILLIPRYGGAGAAIATTITEGLILAIQVWFLKDVIKLENRAKYAIMIYLLGSMAMAAIVYQFSIYGHFSLLSAILLKVVAGIIVYGAVLGLFREKLALGFVKKIFFFKSKVESG
jgi:O-antigen/teichoic acid export membrane protein